MTLEQVFVTIGDQEIANDRKMDDADANSST